MPTGWHVPSESEGDAVVAFLGGPLTGGKGKVSGLADWISPNAGANNESGFTGLPGGWRKEAGVFDQIGTFGYWWSSTNDGENLAKFAALASNFSFWIKASSGKNAGLSVRCIKD